MATTVIHVRNADFSDPNTVYIGREMPRRRLGRSFWANPFKIGQDGTRGQVIALYRRLILEGMTYRQRLSELRGKRLACWCKGTDGSRDVACHGDVLAELADASTPTIATEEGSRD